MGSARTQTNNSAKLISLAIRSVVNGQEAHVDANGRFLVKTQIILSNFPSDTSYAIIDTNLLGFIEYFKTGAIFLLKPLFFPAPRLIRAIGSHDVHSFRTCVELHGNELGWRASPYLAYVLHVLNVSQRNLFVPGIL